MDTQQESEMNKFETYQQIKAANKVSKDWAEMLGKPYHGGGGGTGKIIYLTLCRGEMKSPTICYQYSNGAQNYHACPTVLRVLPRRPTTPHTACIRCRKRRLNLSSVLSANHSH